jgi:mediator of RNA polymerase II transcription subunit 15
MQYQAQQYQQQQQQQQQYQQQYQQQQQQHHQQQQMQNGMNFDNNYNRDNSYGYNMYASAGNNINQPSQHIGNAGSGQPSPQQFNQYAQFGGGGGGFSQPGLPMPPPPMGVAPPSGLVAAPNSNGNSNGNGNSNSPGGNNVSSQDYASNMRGLYTSNTPSPPAIPTFAGEPSHLSTGDATVTGGAGGHFSLEEFPKLS